MNYTIYYRGKLSCCNYHCSYCPFSKVPPHNEMLACDKEQLEKFLDWATLASSFCDSMSIVFIPWGEALIYPWYQKAMANLSKLPHIKKVAIQTNLSCSLDWLMDVNKESCALWTTYHPQEVEEKDFLLKCQILDSLKVRYSVGIVGTKKNMKKAASIKSCLHENVYLWVNAYKDKENYYTKEEIYFYQEIDPLFIYNLSDYPSKGFPCNTGSSVFLVNGDGDIARCPFDKKHLGNIYKDSLSSLSSLKSCNKSHCTCYIGYIHLPHLEFYKLYRDGLLERSYLPI